MKLLVLCRSSTTTYHTSTISTLLVRTIRTNSTTLCEHTYVLNVVDFKTERCNNLFCQILLFTTLIILLCKYLDTKNDNNNLLLDKLHPVKLICKC